LNYNLSIKGHNFFLTAGHELQNSKTKTLSATGTNISDLFFMKENIITGSASVPTIGGSYSKAGFESFFGRLNYDYKSRYFIQGSVRRDGQSSLAPGKRYGTFPGFSAGWRPSEEGFWKGDAFLSKWFTDVKVKGSYAKVGNSLAGLPYLSTFGVANYGNISGIAVNGIGNTDLLWETSQKYDAGIELNMLRGRISITADWFLNDVDNLILDVPVPLSAGIPGNSIRQNVGTLRNNGIELAIDANIITKKDFNWNVNVNYSNVKNKITKLYSISGNPTQQIFPNAYNIIKVGEPINMIWGYEYAGVNTANGNPMYYKADGSLVQLNLTGASNTIGVYYVANSKDDGALGAQSTLSTTNDRKILGQGIPTWFGAINNSLTYKGFGLEFMLRYSGGNKILNTTRQEALLNQSFQNNGTEILERWTTPGQQTTVPKLRWGQGNNINTAGLANSRFVEKGDYLRLQNVVFTYTIPNQVLQKLTKGYVNTIRLYVQGQNLHVWTKYSGADPDNISTGGIDQSVAPQIKTISFGLNVGF
jgi:TonB-dependent starch-binding outer membrane protein SusC